ncbi:hypothetical protein EIN_495750 [Entamoeba invadens IP1]|uniref:Uncharacterized protein n=1 Tax=Entamoeba invadens IP1 TaxID=370355 RepID=A0A0A1U326_ENTIV|nr:hypothetical protein EIN_495750 [Entamoeba invadens IP1]ELP87110.1 hypothetical protein EIN_495750 [Entamoeba invadens IP1]|eukprot:XP_004253881.1 hypothetical protein EIN_495750 [Entamoeba invadens IP1]
MRVSTSQQTRTSFQSPLFKALPQNPSGLESKKPRGSTYFRQSQPRSTYFDRRGQMDDYLVQQKKLGGIGVTTQDEEDAVILRDVKMTDIPNILYAVQPFGKVLGAEDVGDFGVKVKFANRESVKNILLMRKIYIGGKMCETMDTKTFVELRRITQQNTSESVFMQNESLFTKFVEFLYGLWN